MRDGFRIGRLFGIEIRVDWSWVVIAALVTWNLAAAFAHWHANWSPSLSLGLAALATLLFFASVLAHELAHSLVAKRFGISVRRITLFLFGGVSSFEEEPKKPSAEFLTAIVGPITSFVLGVIFLAIGVARSGLAVRGPVDPAIVAAGLDPWSTMLLWLGPINIAVALFNLLPGFPLDGGRVLRAAIWGATGNVERATRWASIVGRFVAALLIASGITMIFGARIPFFGTGLVPGLWLAFIGWFLHNAAARSYEMFRVRRVLEGVRVSQLMRTQGAWVPDTVSLTQMMLHHFVHAEVERIPVFRGGEFVGLVGPLELRSVPRREWDTTPVRSVMVARDKCPVVAPNDLVSTVLGRMAETGIPEVPVVDGGQLVGMLLARDVGRWLALVDQHLVRTGEHVPA